MVKLRTPSLQGSQDEVARQIWDWYTDCMLFMAQGGDPVVAERHARETIQAATDRLSDYVTTSNTLDPWFKKSWMASFYSNLGQALARQKKWDEAIEAQLAAIREDPLRSDHVGNCVQVMLLANRPVQAAELVINTPRPVIESQLSELPRWLLEWALENQAFASALPADLVKLCVLCLVRSKIRDGMGFTLKEVEEERGRKRRRK